MSYCLCSDSKAIEGQKRSVYGGGGQQQRNGAYLGDIGNAALRRSCFAIYLTLLTDLNPVLAVVVIAMALVGYLVTRRLTHWQQDHREEQNRCYVRENYVANKAESDKTGQGCPSIWSADWLMELLREKHPAP